MIGMCCWAAPSAMQSCNQGRCSVTASIVTATRSMWRCLVWERPAGLQSASVSWGARRSDALDGNSGLDLRRTNPPIIEIVNFLFNAIPQNPLLCVVQVYEVINAASLAELKTYFDWSTLCVYALNAPGQNHGIVLASKRWV